jgi:hypothetical protein
MYADTLEELHAMADAIGMKRAWFQNKPQLPHYDLVPARRAKAVKLGAVEHTKYEMVAFMQNRRKALAPLPKPTESKGGAAWATEIQSYRDSDARGGLHDLSRVSKVGGGNRPFEALWWKDERSREMNRGERRFRANHIAERRLNSLPPDMRDQPVGRFRKWNMTCRCSHCMIMREVNMELRRLKDLRRNGFWGSAKAVGE